MTWLINKVLAVSGTETSVSLLLMTSNEGLEDSIVDKVVGFVDFDVDVYSVIPLKVVKFRHWTVTIPTSPPTIKISIWT